jgi:uncharacterized protein (UPF0212 family)
MRDLIAGSDAERSKEADLSHAERLVSRDADQADRDYNQALTAAQKAKHALDHVDTKVGSECDECGHVIESTDVAGAKELAKRTALAKAREAKRLKEAQEVARERAVSAAAELVTFRKSMTDVSAQAVAMSATEAKLIRLREALAKQQVKWADITVDKGKIDALSLKPSPHTLLMTAKLAELAMLGASKDGLELDLEIASVKV